MERLKRHIVGDKIKWLLTGLALVLIFAMLLGLTLNAAGVFRRVTEKTYRFEAEEAVLAGGTQVKEIEGVQCVGEFINNNSTPHTVTFTIESSADCTADLLICLTADSVDRNLSDLAEISVNGVKVNVPYKVVRYADPRTWADWREIEVCEIQLNKGENTLVFTGTYVGANFDYIELTAAREVNLTMESDEETGTASSGETA